MEVVRAPFTLSLFPTYPCSQWMCPYWTFLLNTEPLLWSHSPPPTSSPVRCLRKRTVFSFLCSAQPRRQTLCCVLWRSCPQLLLWAALSYAPCSSHLRVKRGSFWFGLACVLLGETFLGASGCDLFVIWRNYLNQTYVVAAADTTSPIGRSDMKYLRR